MKRKNTLAIICTVALLGLTGCNNDKVGKPIDVPEVHKAEVVSAEVTKEMLMDRLHKQNMHCVTGVYRGRMILPHKRIR